MPEIFRFFGFSFFFYSREHEPIHVHVEGAKGYAKFELNNGFFILIESYGLKANDIERISDVVKDNTDIIIKHWNKYFNQ